MLNGADTLTCTRNGEWEPDPVEVHCIGLPTSITTGHHHDGAPTTSSTLPNFYISMFILQFIAKFK